MAEYRYYLIPDFMSHIFPQQFEEQAPTEFFSNTADLMKRYKQLREMPYNNEYTWNERTNLPYPRLTVGIDRRDPDGAVTIMQVRNGVNYLCDDYRGPFADRNDKQLIEMAKQLVTAVGVDRIRPHYYTEENGHTKVHVGKDIHITEWANAPELCSALRFSRFLNRDGQQLFQVRNGQRIIENYADGSQLVKDVQIVDDTHFYVGSRFCHIQQYANQCFKRGCYVEPEHTEAKKAELFGKVRSGAVRVLMGSTQKMGAGTNVQTRLCALHHLDCPWRPADIAQRNGRMVRQGNMNKEVSIFIYITEATFDAYSYQLVENKQKFISQIMTSKSPARSCEDLDEAALSYAEVKALAAGNPMIKEKMDLDIQVARLRTLKAAYNSQHYRLEDALTGIFLREIRGTECRIQAFEKDMQTAKDSQSYDKDGKLVFSIELDGTSYDKREDAGKALLGLLGAAVRADHPVLVGHYAGFEVTVAYVPLSKVFVAHLVGQATHTTELGSDAAGNMVRLQNVVAALPQEVSGLRNNLQQLRVQLDSAKEELQQPFLQEQELNDKSARLAELDALLNVGNDAPVLEGEAEVVNEDDSVRTPREENELER